MAEVLYFKQEHRTTEFKKLLKEIYMFGCFNITLYES